MQSQDLARPTRVFVEAMFAIPMAAATTHADDWSPAGRCDIEVIDARSPRKALAFQGAPPSSATSESEPSREGVPSRTVTRGPHDDPTCPR